MKNMDDFILSQPHERRRAKGLRPGRFKAVAMPLALALGLPIDTKPIPEPVAKSCLNCGALHTTKKAYCSKECCGQHRRKLRDARR